MMCGGIFTALQVSDYFVIKHCLVAYQIDQLGETNPDSCTDFI